MIAPAIVTCAKMSPSGTTLQRFPNSSQNHQLRIRRAQRFRAYCYGLICRANMTFSLLQKSRSIFRLVMLLFGNLKHIISQRSDAWKYRKIYNDRTRKSLGSSQTEISLISLNSKAKLGTKSNYNIYTLIIIDLRNVFEILFEFLAILFSEIFEEQKRFVSLQFRNKSSALSLAELRRIRYITIVHVCVSV